MFILKYQFLKNSFTTFKISSITYKVKKTAFYKKSLWEYSYV